jgi:hypothetical protein
MEAFSSFASQLQTILALAGSLIALGIGLSLIFNKRARKRRLAELRALYEETPVTDPQYARIRSLYTAASIDAQRGELAADSGGSNTGGSSSGGGDGD